MSTTKKCQECGKSPAYYSNRNQKWMCDFCFAEFIDKDIIQKPSDTQEHYKQKKQKDK